MTRTTKSPLPAKWKEAGRSEEKTESTGDASSSSSRGGVGECAGGKEGNVKCGALGVRGVGVRGSVGDDGVGGGGVGSGSVGAAYGGEGFITAVISLSFVAAPGHAAPGPQVMEYRMDLSSRQGSQEVKVFLGEGDYNDAGGNT